MLLKRFNLLGQPITKIGLCLDDAQLGEVGPGHQVLEPVGLAELSFQSGMISLQTILSTINLNRKRERDADKCIF